MAVSFTTLKLKTKADVKTITINDKEVEVKQYLPAEDKNAILEIAIQEADKGTVVNTFALDCLFHLYIVFKYTNITFTDKQKEDLLKLYDILETNGVIDAVVSAIPENEYLELKTNLDQMVDAYAVYRNGFKGALEQLQLFVPQQAGEMKEILDNIDYSKMNNVLSIAEAAGVQYE